MSDKLTKYQRYNIENPVLAFRGDRGLVEILDKIATDEDISRNKLLYTIVKSFIQEHKNVRIRYEFDV